MKSVSSGSLRGAAIRLFEAKDGELAVAEGLETALGVRMLYGVSVWAAGSAAQLASMDIPDEVSKLFICCDNDDAGIKAAEELGRRMVVRDKAVYMSRPANTGDDWSDVARKEVFGE